MFNNSKYTSWYYEIIANAKKASRKKGGEVYYENHHIIPVHYYRDWETDRKSVV